MRAPEPESEAVMRALDVLIAQEGDPGEELETLNFDALALRNLREGRQAVGGTERRREIARRLRELDDPTGEIADFAERLEASPLEGGGILMVRTKVMSLRLPEELGVETAAVTRTNGVSASMVGDRGLVPTAQPSTAFKEPSAAPRWLCPRSASRNRRPASPPGEAE